jgi:hypothetical protein
VFFHLCVYMHVLVAQSTTSVTDRLEQWMAGSPRRPLVTVCRFASACRPASPGPRLLLFSSETLKRQAVVVKTYSVGPRPGYTRRIL